MMTQTSEKVDERPKDQRFLPDLQSLTSSHYSQLEAGQTTDKVVANLRKLADGFLARGLFQGLPKVWGQAELDRS